MGHSSPHVEKVTDVIKVLNGGIEFYKDGMKKVTSGNIREMFNRMIDEKQQAVLALETFAEQGSKDSHSSWSVEVRSMYTKILSILTSDKNHAYVSQLEEIEDKVLEVIDEALDANQPTVCATELRRIRTRMQQCHDEMKSLQAATA